MKSVLSKLFYDKNDKVIYPFYTLRFFFFLFIFVHHCYGNIRVPLLRQSSLAVSGFIILSGFLTGYIYANKKIKSTFDFTRKRIVKFLPLHIIMLLIMIGISGIFNIHNFSELLVFLKKIFFNIFLLQSWVNDKSYYFSFNGVTWFLSTYLFLCILTKLFLSAIKRINKQKHHNILLILLSILLFYLTLLIVYLVNKYNLNAEYWIYVFPPARVFEYVIGMIFGLLCTNTKINFKYDNIVFTVLEILSVIIMVVWIHYNVFDIFSLLRKEYNSWIIPLVLIIVTFSYQKGIISKLFSMKVLVFLGEISMYMFMIHQPLITYMTRSTGKVVHYRYLGLYMFILTIVLSIIIYRFDHLKVVKGGKK